MNVRMIFQLELEDKYRTSSCHRISSTIISNSPKSCTSGKDIPDTHGV